MEMGIKKDVAFYLGVIRPFLVTFKPQKVQIFNTVD